MPEVRIQAEGSLRFVQASGSGRTWATASAPASGLIAYVQSFSYDSAAKFVQIMERGIPDHHKLTERTPIKITFDCLQTGTFPTAATSQGASVQMWHLEFRASAPEMGGGTGFYNQFHGCPIESIKISEEKEGNKISVSVVALSMTGPTASGYLS